MITIEFWPGADAPPIEEIDFQLGKRGARIVTGAGGVYIASRRMTFSVDVLSGDEKDTDEVKKLLTRLSCRIASPQFNQTGV